ncbi:PepSY-associated TM helix domain-containing protein [Pseudomonas sp. Pseusp3]|uniref:PepSY-associated TM helix domain-containing protein n=1 Tax=Pseudomonas sp. Pseusp3 TaxID=3243029 RepID=UPI0039B0C389
MKEGFRQAMAWLHTWAGLILGWLLFAIFLTGTLAYFKSETSRWMQPEIPVRSVSAETSLTVAQHYLEQHAAGASHWLIELPGARRQGLSVHWEAAAGKPGQHGEQLLDPLTGTEVHPRETLGGEFFYRFHFELQMPYPWGRWLASIAAMLMFVALISGIITHKKIFKDFFTFRPRKGRRSWLDGHYAVGVLVLPFHLMITYSSLVMFMMMVMPAGILAVYKDNAQTFYQEALPESGVWPAVGNPGQLLSLAPLLEQANRLGTGGRVAEVTVNHPGDANASVVMAFDGADRVVHDFGRTVTFDGVTGRQLDATPERSLPVAIAGSFFGLHMGHFASPVLRWLYFLCGLAGTAMIGTGMVIWVGKRQLKHAQSAGMPLELRLVDVLNIASMSGLMLAVATYFWANRLLPVAMAGRSDWEVNGFFIVWGLSLLHAMLRRGRAAWVEQLALAALLFGAVPLLNALTTPYHLGMSLAQSDGAMAGFDLACLASGLFFAWSAWKIRRSGRTQAVSTKRPRSMVLEQEAN